MKNALTIECMLLGVIGMMVATIAVGAPGLPHRKPGQWEITLTSDNPKIPTRIEDICLDERTEAMFEQFALGTSRDLCSTFDWKNLGGGKASVDAICKLGGTQMTVHGDVAFAGDTAYREDIRVHYTPPLRGKSDSVSVHEAKWTGGCAADMKPGDIVARPNAAMPAPVRINLNELSK